MLVTTRPLAAVGAVREAIPARREAEEVVDFVLASPPDSVAPAARGTGLAVASAGLVSTGLGVAFGSWAGIPCLFLGLGAGFYESMRREHPGMMAQSMAVVLGSATAGAAAELASSAGPLAALAAAAGGGLLAGTMHLVLADDRHSEADRKLAEWAQRVEDALGTLKMAAPGSGSGVEERGNQLAVGGVLVRRKNGSPSATTSVHQTATDPSAPTASPTQDLRNRIAAREQELAETLPAPGKLKLKAALCLAGGAAAALAAGALLGMAGLEPGSMTRELALIGGGLIPGALAAGLANKAMQGVEDKTQLGLSIAATMLGSYFLATAMPGGNPVAIGIITTASTALAALVARGFRPAYNGVPARLEGLKQTLDRFDEMQALEERLRAR